MAPASASVRFYVLIFSIVLVCLKLTGKWHITAALNRKNIWHSFA